ncbi:DUF4405 domain-containing protein [Albidovulum sp.]|uniref:DUF4405 domain-containing protein n=1 Tax=Albidovulum sp. TaxID=1872424 RepID=UPI0039B988F7
MPSLLNRYATPLMTGLFLVSLLSGIALFFHWVPSVFHGMHEWLSMVLILPFALHLWKNWRPMTAYARHLPMALSLALSLVAAGLFAVSASQGEGRGGPPQMQLAQTVLAGTPDLAAPLFGRTGAELVEALQAAGFAGAEAGLSLRDIAAASGKTDADLAVALMALSS